MVRTILRTKGQGKVRLAELMGEMIQRRAELEKTILINPGVPMESANGGKKRLRHLTLMMMMTRAYEIRQVFKEGVRKSLIAR